MNSNRSRLLKCASAALVTSFAPWLSSLAQEVEQTSLEEIVVVAQRREERLQDVPLTITAVTANTLSASGVPTTRELAMVVPGLTISSGGPIPQPSIRGIGTRGATAGDESVVPVYIDGVYQPFQAGLFFSLNNVERIEVLKGPQGILFGRNATGGAINIITRRPEAAFGLDGSASYGNYGSYEGKLYATGGSDTIAVDFAGSVRGDDGFVRDVVRGTDLASTEEYAVRGSLLFTPNDRFDLRVAVSDSKIEDNQGFTTQPVNRNTIALQTTPGLFVPTAPWETALSFDPEYTVTQTAASAVATLHFDALDLVSISGWQENKFVGLSDSDASSRALATLDYSVEMDAINQEIYAASRGEHVVDWLVGAFYHGNEAGYPYFITNGGTPVISQVDTDSYAGYAQVTVHLGDQWSLIGGGRYTKEEKHYTARRGATGTPVIADAEFSRFTPSATLQFEPTDNINLYARYSEAFKAGLFNQTALLTTAVKPEEVTQYELGLKARLNSSFQFNAAVYRSDYTDIQVTVRDPATSVTGLQNAAEAQLTGGEAEISWIPLPGLTVTGGLSIIDAEYEDFFGAQVTTPRAGGGNTTEYVDASGNKLVKVPEQTYNLSVQYATSLAGGELDANVSALYTGEQFWDPGNRLVEDPYTLINAELGWTTAGGGYRVALWGQNLTDEVYSASVSTTANADWRSFGRPRTYGIRVNFNLR